MEDPDVLDRQVELVTLKDVAVIIFYLFTRIYHLTNGFCKSPKTRVGPVVREEGMIRAAVPRHGHVRWEGATATVTPTVLEVWCVEKITADNTIRLL